MDPPPKPSQSPSQSPPAHHQSDADEDDETVKQLKECSSLYLSLQDCLVKTNRNWKSCQMESKPSLFSAEVQALKACNDRRKNAKRN